jgi:hypothetical protein
MPNPAKIKIFLLVFIVAQLFLSYVNVAYATTTPAYTGVQGQISAFLCTPTDTSNNTAGSTSYIGGADNAALNNTAGTDLYGCINKIYRFAIAFGTAIGIGFIVVAGYVYMAAEGNQESVDKAKSIFTSTITAMVILFAGYVLLRAINPDLLQFHNVQPPTVTSPVGGIAGPTGGGGAVTLSDTKTAAQTLMDLSSQGKLSIASTGCDCAGNCAINTLQTLATGNPAVRDGQTLCNLGTTPVSSQMLNALITLANSGNNFMIQSITGGHHSSDADPHYKGQAVDITPNPATADNQAKFASLLRQNGASTVASECSTQYIPLKVSNDSVSSCIGVSGYHLHVQW